MKTIAAVLVLTVFAACVSAQAPATATAAGCPLEPVQFHVCALSKMKAFNPPRTPDDVTCNKEPGFELLEQACHEGNRAVEAGRAWV